MISMMIPFVRLPFDADLAPSCLLREAASDRCVFCGACTYFSALLLCAPHRRQFLCLLQRL